MARWGNCDFEQLKRLQKKMEKLESGDFDKFCRECANELAARLLAHVIRRTPVGKYENVYQEVQGDDRTIQYTTKKGEHRFRTVKGKKYKFLISGTGKTGGTLRRSWTAGETTKSGGVYEIEVKNSCFYASYVEFGHRQTIGRYVPAIGKRLTKGWVKGQFMLTISEKDIETSAPKILEKKIEEYLRRVFSDQQNI